MEGNTLVVILVNYNIWLCPCLLLCWLLPLHFNTSCLKNFVFVAATGLPKLEIDAMDEEIKDVQATRVSSSDASFSSQISSNSLPPTYSKGARERPEEHTGLGIGDSTIGKTSSSASVSTSYVRDTSTETAALPAEEDQSYCSGPSMKMRTSENISLNAVYSDTLEASIIDLEELVNKVKWLKGILELGAPLSNAGRPPWKFMEST